MVYDTVHKVIAEGNFVLIRPGRGRQRLPDRCPRRELPYGFSRLSRSRASSCPGSSAVWTG
ncbi:hypothetical protein DMB66_50730 [Actinoplanes sp. ATCC 53533]|nr:hypothetical protein DMB66_50730 [Actinoplanes sp. ATCC 53533]